MSLHDQAQVSPELAAVIDKMVRYDFQRYPSASEALQALKVDISLSGTVVCQLYHKTLLRLCRINQ